MERDMIKSMVGMIPVSELGKVPDHGETWEKTDGGAHFKASRHRLTKDSGYDLIPLTVYGEPGERERIVSEFAGVLGEPSDVFVLPNSDHDVTVADWFLEREV